MNLTYSLLFLHISALLTANNYFAKRHPNKFESAKLAHSLSQINVTKNQDDYKQGA
jgi:hypothetical protein